MPECLDLRLSLFKQVLFLTSWTTGMVNCCLDVKQFKAVYLCTCVCVWVCCARLQWLISGQVSISVSLSLDPRKTVPTTPQKTHSRRQAAIVQMKDRTWENDPENIQRNSTCTRRHFVLQEMDCHFSFSYQLATSWQVAVMTALNETNKKKMVSQRNF